MQVGNYDSTGSLLFIYNIYLRRILSILNVVREHMCSHDIVSLVYLY